MSRCPADDCDYPAGTACARFPCPGRSLRGFPNSNSRPTLDQWLLWARTSFAGGGTTPSDAPGEAGGFSNAARQPYHETPLRGVGRGAGPETGSASVMASGAQCPAYMADVLPFHAGGNIR